MTIKTQFSCTVGGTIHSVVNNQVAFTTDLRSGRSSQYCIEVAKALNAPILHVIGDDMETAVHVCELAAERRWTDLVFHRRFGHDEIDKPSFTQPKCTRLLEITPQLFRSTKTKSGQVAKEHIDRINKKVNASLNEEFLASKDYVPHRRDWLSSHWLDLSHLRVKPEILRNVGKAITSLPGNFLANRAVKKVDSLKLTTKGTNDF